MRKLLFAGLVALLVPTASHAQFQLGLRVGYAPAMGDAAKDAKMSDVSLSSQIPLQLDANYKLDKDFAVGVYFSYGFGQVDNKAFGDACGVSGIDCSGSSGCASRPAERVMACSIASNGLKVLTPQSLPPAIRAPASSSERAGYR